MNKPLFSGEIFERIAAIFISLVVIQAAAVSYLETHASIEADKAERAAGQFAIQAMGERSRGQIEYGYAYGDAFRLWNAYDVRAITARERDDTEAAERYETLAETVIGLTPLLGDEYFVPEDTDLNNAAYEADLFLVETTVLSEKFKNMAQLDDEWEAKAQAYVAQLTILAVSLFLYGISTTVGGQTRYLFTGVSTVLALFTLGWMITVADRPISVLPDAAIEAYARGEGLYWQYEEADAVEAYDEAIELAPNYAQAYFGRGLSYFDLDDLDSAIADLEQAVALGMNTTDVLTELGFVYYLNGNLTESQTIAEQRLSLSSVDLLDYFDIGLVSLASGDIPAAQSAYEDGLQVIADVVQTATDAGTTVSDDVWFYFDLGWSDLDNLIQCVEVEDCDGAPPFDAIVVSDETVPAAQELMIRLKEYAVALEYTDKPPVEITPPTISNLVFVDSTGQMSDTFPPETQEVIARLDYQGVQEGQLVVAKIYINGEEFPSLRYVRQWDSSASGTAELPISVGDGSAFILNPGEYSVDLFVDANYLGSGGFFIESDDSESLAVIEAEGGMFTYPVDDIGFSLSLPEDWYELVWDDEDLLYTANPDETDYIYIYVVYDAPDDLQEIGQITLDAFGMDLSGEFMPITLAGQDALMFDLFYESDGLWKGRAVAVNIDGVGVVFSAEVLEGDPTETYNLMVGGVAIP